MDEFNDYNLAIKEYILQDEKLLWSGKPVKQIKLLPAEKFNIIIGIFWTVFAVFWMALAFVSASSVEEEGFTMTKILPFFGIPFILIGIYMIFISPIRIKNKRKALEYALTNKRILILYNGKKQAIYTFKYSDIQNVDFGCDEDGVGCVTFMKLRSTTDSTGTKHPRLNNTYGLYNISDVKKVYKIFCKQLGEKEL